MGHTRTREGLIEAVSVDLFGDGDQLGAVELDAHSSEQFVEALVARPGAEGTIGTEELTVHGRGRRLGGQVEPGVDEQIPRQLELLLDQRAHRGERLLIGDDPHLDGDVQGAAGCPR